MPDSTVATFTRFDDKFRAVFALFLLMGFLGYLFYASYRPPQLPGDLLGAVFGWFAGWIGATISFYWGSSSSDSGSKQNAPTMAISPTADSKTTVTTETPKP